MQQQQNKLILYLVIALGLVGGYFYYSQALAEPEIAPIPQAGTEDFNQFRNLKIDFSLLQKAEYRALRAYGESPVNPGLHGKTDPFAQ